MAFGKVPVSQRTEKQREFVKASDLAGSPVDSKKLRTEMGICEDCGQQKVVVFYLL
jgi:hypothetical protein